MKKVEENINPYGLKGEGYLDLSSSTAKKPTPMVYRGRISGP